MTRFRHIGLTNRLVALMGGLLVVGCLVVGIATTFALRTFLMNRLDAQLAAAGQRYSLSLEHPGDGDGDADDSTFESTVGQSSGTVGARVLDGQGDRGRRDRRRLHPAPSLGPRPLVPGRA